MKATPLTWYALSPRFWSEVWALVVLLYPSAWCAEVYETAVNVVLQLGQALLQVQAGVAGAVLLASVTAGDDALLPSVWACTLYAAVGLLQIVAALLGERLRIKWRRRIVGKCHTLYFRPRHPYWLTPAGWDALTDGRKTRDGELLAACENPDQRLTADVARFTRTLSTVMFGTYDGPSSVVASAASAVYALALVLSSVGSGSALLAAAFAAACVVISGAVALAVASRVYAVAASTGFARGLLASASASARSLALSGGLSAVSKRLATRVDALVGAGISWFCWSALAQAWSGFQASAPYILGFFAALVVLRGGGSIDSIATPADFASRLSSGELQKLAIARLLLQRPRLAFLDEATSEMDPAAEARALEALRLAGVTTVSVGHRAALEGMHDRHICLERDLSRGGSAAATSRLVERDVALSAAGAAAAASPADASPGSGAAHAGLKPSQAPPTRRRFVPPPAGTGGALGRARAGQSLVQGATSAGGVGVAAAGRVAGRRIACCDAESRGKALRLLAMGFPRLWHPQTGLALAAVAVNATLPLFTITKAFVASDAASQMAAGDFDAAAGTIWLGFGVFFAASCTSALAQLIGRCLSLLWFREIVAGASRLILSDDQAHVFRSIAEAGCEFNAQAGSSGSRVPAVGSRGGAAAADARTDGDGAAAATRSRPLRVAVLAAPDAPARAAGGSGPLARTPVLGPSSEGVDSLDQRLIGDGMRLSEELGTVVFGGEGRVSIFQVLMSIALVAAKAASIGWLAVAASFAFTAAGLAVNQCLLRSIPQRVCALERTEGLFRGVHAGARISAEQIALLRGEPAERARADSAFRAVARAAFDLVWGELPARLENKVIAYVGTAAASVFVALQISATGSLNGDPVALGPVLELAGLLISLNLYLCALPDYFTNGAELSGLVSRVHGLLAAAERAAPRLALGASAEAAGSITVSGSPASGGASPPCLVAAEALSVPRAGGGSGPALASGVRLALRGSGARVLVGGPNGAGKSTLVDVLVGKHVTHSTAPGTVKWALPGKEGPCLGEEGGTWVLTHRPFLFPGTLREQLAFPRPPSVLAGAAGDADAERALRAVGLGCLLDAKDSEKRLAAAAATVAALEGEAVGADVRALRALGAGGCCGCSQAPRAAAGGARTVEAAAKPGRGSASALAGYTAIGEAAVAAGVLDAVADWAAVLSGGERQRLAAARAMLARPRVVVMDEALSALPAASAEVIMAELAETAGLVLVAPSAPAPAS
ncbi:hypothetical protein FNF27_01951 [Cafeteria roenbergensis]|uniref:ABC transporter domain-containing protein n=1 Tax=Cafeteria roenbergensis TaxID=33653 RepID=A0A5A8EL45_CAFRO|nr:hypothetical protein FNF27_01951 [Cafeteria roenbergensis]